VIKQFDSQWKEALEKQQKEMQSMVQEKVD